MALYKYCILLFLYFVIFNDVTYTLTVTTPIPDVARDAKCHTWLAGPRGDRRAHIFYLIIIIITDDYTPPWFLPPLNCHFLLLLLLLHLLLFFIIISQRHLQHPIPSRLMFILILYKHIYSIIIIINVQTYSRFEKCIIITKLT